jgi:predicted nucleic acid-binding protein
MLSKLGRGVALAFLDGLDNASTTSTTIVRVSLADEQRAKAILRNYDDKDFSFTDATSFSIMERLRLYGGFTFDSDFERYGLTALTE